MGMDPNPNPKKKKLKQNRLESTIIIVGNFQNRVLSLGPKTHDPSFSGAKCLLVSAAKLPSFGLTGMRGISQEVRMRSPTFMFSVARMYLLVSP